MTKTRIVTHSSSFHADDVFGVATLIELLGEENVEVIRSRDPEIIASGDYVLDTGDVYDPARKRFDHHQEGGAGKRENGIPYASFGLLWKEFGEKLCGSMEGAHDVEMRLVIPIDAGDNGVSTWDPKFPDIKPYTIGSAISALIPLFGEDQEEIDACFMRAVALARLVLTREIKAGQVRIDMESSIRSLYETAEDKRLLVFDLLGLSRGSIGAVLAKLPDLLYFVLQNKDGNWTIGCVTDSEEAFKNRKNLPSAWAGKRGQELVQITGVPDALFCHNGLFMAVAKSKEGALKLAEIALASKN